jgi:dipeptidase E
VSLRQIITLGGGGFSMEPDNPLDRFLLSRAVLCGISAGMNCWFEQSVTGSFDVNRLRALDDGLGLLQGSCCPHDDGEPQRRPTYQRLIRSGVLTAGWAADDGAAIVFAEGSEPDAVSSWPTAAHIGYVPSPVA